MMMIAVVLITRLARPPARIRSASCCAETSSSAAIRALSSLGFMPSRPAAATAWLEERAELTTARLPAGRTATAASSAALLIVLLPCAGSATLRVIVAAATSIDTGRILDTQAPCKGDRNAGAAPRPQPYRGRPGRPLGPRDGFGSSPTGGVCFA